MKGGASIDEAMIFLMRDYIQEMLDIENGMEALKSELALRRDFTLGGAFNLFSRTLQGRVTVEELLFGLERLDMNV